MKQVNGWIKGFLFTVIVILVGMAFADPIGGGGRGSGGDINTNISTIDR